MLNGNGQDADGVGRTIKEFHGFSPASHWRDGNSKPIPWLVEGCFIKGTVAMLSSDGGLGKSLLAQQLLTAGAINSNWLGLDVKRARTYGFFCEDDIDELERRQNAINDHYGIQMADLDDVWMVERVARDNIMFRFDKKGWKLVHTPIWTQFQADVIDFGAQIVVIDHVREVFGGNEIDAQQIAQFVRELRGLARKIDGVVLLLAHVSNEGMKEGSGLAGNRAWNNSVRSRLYLTAKGGTDGPTNDRFLKTMKNNQGPYGGKIVISYDHGVFVRQEPGIDEEGQSDEPSQLRKAQCADLLVEVITHLINTGNRLSAQKRAPTYALNLAKDDGRLRRFSGRELEAAKDRLIHKGDLQIISLKTPGHGTREFIRPKHTLYPIEIEAQREPALDNI